MSIYIYIIGTQVKVWHKLVRKETLLPTPTLVAMVTSSIMLPFLHGRKRKLQQMKINLAQNRGFPKLGGRYFFVGPYVSGSLDCGKVPNGP